MISDHFGIKKELKHFQTKGQTKEKKQMATSGTDLGALYNEQVSQSKIWQVIGASAVVTMIHSPSVV